MFKKLQWKKSIFTELLTWFLLLSLTPVFIVSILAYKNSADSLYTAVSSELEHSSRSYLRFIDNWFYYRTVDINSWSSNQNTVSFMKTLNSEMEKSKLSLAEFVKSDNYAKLILPYEHDIIKLSHQYDYIYDVFLFDTQANLLYTVVKEDDLATNFFTGKYKQTLFANTLKKSLKNRKVYFSDIELYQPSNNGIFGFITSPIVNKKGKVIGIYAIQIKPHRIFSQFKKINEEDNGIFHYLLGGKDLILRSSILNEDEVLKRTINTKQTEVYQHEHINKTQKMSNEIERSYEYTGPTSQTVIGLHHPITILGVDWVLISEITKEHALEPTHKLALFIFLLALLGIVFVTLGAIFVTRRLTKPLSILLEASQNFAKGKREAVWIDSDNEIGALANAFNEMVDEISEKEQKAYAFSQETQKALHELKEQKLALDAHAIVAITDIKGNITYVNKKFEEISGYTREELLGKNHRILNSGEHNISIWKEMYSTLSKGLIWHKEIKNRTKEGNFYWVDTTIVPFLGEDGKPESYIALRADITTQKLNKQELIKAKEDAEAALVAKSSFLASMSHEIRTPMNGVIGMLGLLKNSKLTEVQSHQLSLAQSSAQSLLSLINDILDFSKVDAGKLELENLEFNLRDELGDFVEAIGHRAQEKGVEIILDVRKIERQCVICDPGRLRQILNNLVGNSIKFTKEGEILITASLEELTQEEGSLTISIKDSGIGIPKDKISSLFEAFTQVDASTTRKYGGTGLGLSIVQKLTALMGGSIKVESIEGKGSTFSFTISVGMPKKRSQVKPSISIENRRVLIVDDNTLNRKTLSEQLSYWGMQSFEAKDAKEALTLCEKEYSEGFSPPFDIILIDMHMPEISGADLGKKIKDNAHFKEIKMVMMTSLASRGNAAEFKEIGFNAFFPKPATTKDLYKALNVLVEQTQELNQEDALKNQDKTLDVQEKEIWPEDTRILLVEDNMTNQIVANGILETFGLHADTANNGEEAIHALKTSLLTQAYSLVLMDCQMPILDGYGATEAIRKGEAGEENKKIPILAMTANAMDGDKQKCLLSGMDDYLSKPINPEKLKEILVLWLMPKH